MLSESKSKKFRVLAIILASIMTLSAFTFSAGCGKETEQANTDETVADESDVIVEESTEVPKILPNLDDSANFEGYEFRILTRNSTSGDWDDWVPRDIFAQEETGDVINDAVYKRNRYIEDKYNFTITQIQSGNISGDVKKAINAGDNTYDAVYPGLRDTPAMAQQGHFLDLHEIPNIDLTQPWWDQRAVASLSIGGKLYFTSGDIMMINNDACPGIVFNKGLLQSLALENPYELVRNNQWTIEKLHDMMKGAARDVNGDGVMTYTDDVYGFIGQRDSLIAFFHGAGEIIAQKDENDLPYLTFGSERAYQAMEDCYDIMYDMTTTHNAHHLEGKVPAIYPVSEEMFMGDRALFMWVRLRIVQNLRSMNTDFGILPMPKLDSTQKEWGHTVNSYTGCSIAIPVTAPDPERTGHIIEAMAAEAKYTTMPAYYDVALKTKFARDDDSSEMLDIIFNSTVFDIGEIYNFGSFSGDLIYMSMTNDRNIASKFEKSEAKMQTAIDKAITAYEKLDY